ncbi:MAG TPA: hypothetical protein VFS32_05650, partial [Candidatus Limnocylindrales bacterium]|nr:hypothetical protein [Candidatus Limnocylindrales bacterium]
MPTTRPVFGPESLEHASEDDQPRPDLDVDRRELVFTIWRHSVIASWRVDGVVRREPARSPGRGRGGPGAALARAAG